MIIIIGGESMTGKTLMAQKLLETYKIPYLSADHLKMGLFRADNNCGFTPDDYNEIIEEKLWPILKGIIETNIENEQSLIIEGCYISPRRVNEFAADCRKHIIPVFMGFSNEYLENNFASGVLKHRSIIERRTEAEERKLGWFIEANEKIKKQCAMNGIRYFEINSDYQKDTAAIYKWIASEVEKMRFLR